VAAAIAAAGTAPVGPASAGPASGGPATAGSVAPGSAGCGERPDPVDLLARLGYEPVLDGAEIRLRNCPFGVVAHAFPPLVCGLNLSLVEGVLAGGGFAANAAARIDPGPDGCCVAVRLANVKITDVD
jgi:hypothetical protein